MVSLQKHFHYSVEWVKALQFSPPWRKIRYLKSLALQWHCWALKTPLWCSNIIREHAVKRPWLKLTWSMKKSIVTPIPWFALCYLNDPGENGAVAITWKLSAFGRCNSRDFRHGIASWGLVLDILKSKEYPFLASISVHGQLTSVWSFPGKHHFSFEVWHPKLTFTEGGWSQRRGSGADCKAQGH